MGQLTVNLIVTLNTTISSSFEDTEAPPGFIWEVIELWTPQSVVMRVASRIIGHRSSGSGWVRLLGKRLVGE